MVMVGCSASDAAGSSREPSATPPDAAQPGPEFHGEPCSGNKTDRETAKSQTQFSILFPHDPLAGSDEVVEEVWDCDREGVVLTYGTGISVVERPASVSVPEAAWRAIVADDPSAAHLDRVQGVAALLVHPNEDPLHEAAGAVTFVKSDVQVNVIGNTELSMDELIRVAESLAAD
jgi:hypothetical protein